MNIKIFTDGSAKGNPGPGGYGVFMRFGNHEKEFSEGFRLTTNNRMELLAVIKGLESLKTTKYPIEVFTDSKYVADAITKKWVHSWQVKKYKGKKNKDLWERYLTAAAPYNITVHWIKGHNGHPENERCDRLAVGAASNPHLIDVEYEKESAL